MLYRTFFPVSIDKELAYEHGYKETELLGVFELNGSQKISTNTLV